MGYTGIQSGQVFEHYENLHRYEIVGFVFDVDTKERKVLYKPLYECEHELFSRAMDIFTGTVMHKGRMVERFRLI